MLEPEVSPDPVVRVHHEVPDAQRPQVVDERLRLRALLAALPARPARARAEDLFFGDERDLARGQREARRQLADEHLDLGADRVGRSLRAHEINLREHEPRVGVVRAQEGGHALGLRGRAARHHHAIALLVPVAHVLDEGGERVVLSLLGAHRFDLLRESVERLCAEVHQRGVRRDELERARRGLVLLRRATHSQVVREQLGRGEQALDHLGFVQVERVSREARLSSLDAVSPVAQRALELFSQRLEHPRGLVEHPRDVAREVVEHALERLVVRGQKAVGAEEPAAALDVLGDADDLRVRHVELVAQGRHALSCAHALCGADERLAHRVKKELFDRAQRALAVGVEQLDREAEIFVELDARGVRRGRGPHVDDRAADREGSGVFDDRDAEVSALDHPRDELVAIDELFGLNEVRARRERRARNDLAHERSCGDDEHAPRQPLRQMKQRGEPAHRDRSIRRDLDEGRVLGDGHDQHFAVRLVGLAVLGLGPAAGEKELDVTSEFSRGFEVARDHDEPAPRALRALGDEPRERAASGAAEVFSLQRSKAFDHSLERGARARGGDRIVRRGNVGRVRHSRARIALRRAFRE